MHLNLIHILVITFVVVQVSASPLKPIVKWITIDKGELTLTATDSNDSILLKVPCSIGKVPGNKIAQLDGRTPEGIFSISEICNSSSWKHDFHDGKGEIPNAYGPYFIRINVPNFNRIGIHGTHLPESIGKRTTEGCIRLRNEDVIELRELISRTSTKVNITPGKIDKAANARNYR